MARIPYAIAPNGSLNLFRMLAHSPPVLKGFEQLGAALLTDLSLSPRLREAAILRTGFLAGATYETSKHEKIASWVGLTDEEIAALEPMGNSKHLEPVLAAIAELAGQLHEGVEGKEETIRELRKHLTDREVVEVVVTTGFYGMVCRILQTLAIDLEQA